MQNTRLNTLIDRSLDRLVGWLQNPWRRLSVLIISLLFGNFLGTAVATTAGQRADLDVLVAALLVLISELVSRVVYRDRRTPTRSLLMELLNALKVGLTFSLFVEAFKLGS
ncbi:DUF565 domain-containing protein [Leptolyngbya sp. FACHB-36]|uniref:DUF565 domain-containing protein n=1 Tax=Leptolyngbya sp. FACHB-36 TaxID=2692808 RepID=UPI00168020E0|nr:DUF565 domain-containing protein [Leptolyngbya sp. FACHB-36]MBD2018763.1 DUF565 domain-containing protein [Leptolyngbya sp. FACHB-36]